MTCRSTLIHTALKGTVPAWSVLICVVTHDVAFEAAFRNAKFHLTQTGVYMILYNLVTEQHTQHIDLTMNYVIKIITCKISCSNTNPCALYMDQPMASIT